MDMNENRNEKLSRRLPEKGAREKRRLAAVLTLVLLLPLLTVTALASDGGAAAPLTALENFKNLMVGVVRIIGAVLALYGIVQAGMSIQSHDSSQRVNGLMSLAGGLLIAFAPEILAYIGVSI